MGSYQTTVALLVSKEEGMRMILLKELDLLPNVFESGQDFNHINAVLFSDCFCHIGRYDGSHQCTIFWQTPRLFSGAQLILSDQKTRHISGKWHIISGFGIFCINTKAICIRVCCQNQIRICLLCQFQSQRKCFRIFRVRIRHSWKISIRQFLLRNHLYLREPKLFEHAPDRKITGSMERCIDNLQAVSHLFDHIRT